MSTAKLEAEWQARLDAQQQASEQALSALRGDLVKAHQAELDELARQHAEDVASLKSLLQKSTRRRRTSWQTPSANASSWRQH